MGERLRRGGRGGGNRCRSRRQGLSVPRGQWPRSPGAALGLTAPQGLLAVHQYHSGEELGDPQKGRQSPVATTGMTEGSARR